MKSAAGDSETKGAPRGAENPYLHVKRGYRQYYEAEGGFHKYAPPGFSVCPFGQVKNEAAHYALTQWVLMHKKTVLMVVVRRATANVVVFEVDLEEMQRNPRSSKLIKSYWLMLEEIIKYMRDNPTAKPPPKEELGRYVAGLGEKVEANSVLEQLKKAALEKEVYTMVTEPHPKAEGQWLVRFKAQPNAMPQFLLKLNMTRRIQIPRDPTGATKEQLREDVAGCAMLLYPRLRAVAGSDVSVPSTADRTGVPEFAQYVNITDPAYYYAKYTDSKTGAETNVPMMSVDRLYIDGPPHDSPAVAYLMGVESGTCAPVCLGILGIAVHKPK